MKKASILFFLFFLMIGCSEKTVEKLTRVDVQITSSDGSYGEVVMVVDQSNLEAIQQAFTQMKWQPNVEAEMARMEDLKATFFIQFDKNMPERLYEYLIWFNDGGTSTIISNNPKEGYGSLDKENTMILKKILYY